MKRLAVIAAALLLLARGLDARQSETFAPSGAGFRVAFPGKPKESTTTPTTKLGKLKVITATFATADGNVYMASYTDFPEGTGKPENVAALLDGVREGLKGGKSATVLTDDSLKLGADELPGRDLVLVKDNQHIRVRAVLRGDRLYQVGLIGAKSFVTGKDAAAFLKSFELTR